MNWSKNRRRFILSRKALEAMLLFVLLFGASWGYGACFSSDGEENFKKAVKPQEIMEAPITNEPEITVTVQLKTGEMLTQELEEYIINVVAAEMPADFPQEALKAQAVAARSYCLHYLSNNAYIPAGTIAQDWLSEEEQKKRWQDNFALYHEKIAAAVYETKGEVLYWQNNVITAAYHASCGGKQTASAEEMWGGTAEYLSSVPCPHGEEKYSGVEHVFKKQEIAQALKRSGMKTIKVISVTKSGRAAEVKIDDDIYAAAKIRTALSLSSSIFTLKTKGDEVIITTYGSGHGVGMCQYGARYYAMKGWDYKKILAHFYPQTTLRQV